MTLDPLAIGLAVALIVAFVLIGSRSFPEQMNIAPWRYNGRRDRPSDGAREDDDARFNWASDERKDDDEP
jgi:hypothetical protein